MTSSGAAQSKNESFCQVLVDGGKLSPMDVERVRRLEKETKERLHLIVAKLGMVSESEVALALATSLDLPMAGEDDYPSTPIASGSFTVSFLKQHRVVPLREEEDCLCLAMADPTDQYAIKAMEMSAGVRISPWVGVPAEVENALDRLYKTEDPDLSGYAHNFEDEDDRQTEQDIARLRDMASEAPVIRMVNQLINNAVELRASDIHIEPFERRLRVRYRLDGVLRDVDAPPHHLQAAIVSRIKIMAGLNIAERRLPQDGRIKITVRGKDIDMRISTIPVMFGESVVMRILDREEIRLDFEELGFSDPALPRFRETLNRPNGILLVTGPTGSGKTTTLYACLTELNKPNVKILTVEDPIEYQIEGINQVQVKPQIGLTFVHALRSFLRQDPDILMIGEIRDLETAEIAVQASLTGHLVLSTLHTNDAASSISRLLDMQVEDYLLASTVSGVLAQRLVRKLCPHCKEPHADNSGILERLGVKQIEGQQLPPLFKAVGCSRCRGGGFLGRTTIVEFLPVTDRIRGLVLQHANAQELRRAAIEDGMSSMYDDGLRKIVDGITTIEEVLRVTSEE